ncbi:2',3'-cyclic-nucleotide 2'-phosphodiesterase (5'-nucleotidase family) [Thiogranum longum]|uniref:2',3'-cyclic-nucleotide 2'-phosphodiesterase (5'-nucleotidase family) n=1 Tax=Thiogranum longum TaxID=1537524 RepID=A0A4R1HA40_9GAMM|nr:5'-nucleotidase C-terminal domain-containing protein [Thiogranum longum]TCK17363.1 2',3'-cyclic-nucleotide 2'-phosphodiesterase (5'-nucleotidase family) [Thiogranum longum]
MQFSSFTKLAAAAALSILVSACGGGGASQDATAAEQSSGVIGSKGTGSDTGNSNSNSNSGTVVTGTTVTFMHMNDLHAHLTPHQDRVVDTQGESKIVERGGLARMATLIQRIRTENPDSVLMNIGDTYHGGAEAMFTLGNAIVDPVNALGIDVGVPGNWDFGYSSVVFRLRYTDTALLPAEMIADKLMPTFTAIKKPNFPNLAANMTSRLTGETVLPPTLMKDVNGVQVGFIGLTSDIVKFVYPLLAPLFDFAGDGQTSAEAEATYRDLVNQYATTLRNEGADIVVVMSELGIHKDFRLAQIVDNGAVDVFFSAHTHEATFEPLVSGSGALVVEAGNDGYLGRMDITVEGGKVTGRNWELLTIDSTLPEDEAVAALVRKARAPFMAADIKFSDPMPNSLLALVKPLDTVVGYTDTSLDRRGALQNTFNNAMTDIMRNYGQTDLAMNPGFRFDAEVASGVMLEDNTLATGDITLEDIYRFYPLMFTLATAEVAGARLKEILEESLSSTFSPDAFRQRGGWLEGWSGLQLTVNLANPDGQRVLEMRLKDSGELITDSTLVTVTGCKRPIEPRDILCRHSGFNNVAALLATGTGEPWSIIDLLIEGVSTGVLFDAGRQDIVDLNSTPMWPLTPFIQPLEGVQ